MKALFLILMFVNLQAQAFSIGERSPFSGAKVVLGFNQARPESPLQFPCVYLNGEVLCDPELIQMSHPVCLRTLNFEKTIQNQYIISCQLSLSKSLVLAKSFLGDKPFDRGFLHLELNPAVKLESIYKPRKSGFGYFMIQIQ